MSDAQPAELLEITTEIVTAYVQKNHIRTAELPSLIASIHMTLTGMTDPVNAPPPEPELKPAVSIKKSITDEYIISLEDGRKLKSMKRYLSKLGMTPEQYRAKWGLPKDYPMTAPSYAAKRSELAKTIGLGRKTAAATPEPASTPTRGRGRPKATPASA